MSSIRFAAHRTFMLQCQSLLDGAPDDAIPATAQTEKLKSDLENLQTLLDCYAQALSKLPVLANEYHMLHRRIRIDARKIQHRKKRSPQKTTAP